MEVLDEGTPAETKSGMGRDELLEELICVKRNKFASILFEIYFSREENENEKRMRVKKEALGNYKHIRSTLAYLGEQMSEKDNPEEYSIEDLLEAIKMMKLKLYRLQLKTIFLQLVLLAMLLDVDALYVFIRLERDRSCCAIVLLSNKGAHAYYGNGNFLARHRRGDRLPLVIHEEIEVVVEENRIVIQKKATKCCNTSLHDDQNATYVGASKQNEIDEFADTSNLSFDILQRKPSDQELWTMAFNIGWEYPQLASMLGLSETELYHIKYDNRDNCVQRNKAMLFKWRENIENDGTFEELRNACIRAKINPGKILKGIERV